MELIFLKKIIDILVNFLTALFKKKSLRDDCKKAGDKVSKAIQELLSLRPNLNKVKALLSEAEKLCPSDSADLYRAKEMLESIQVASRSIERSSAAGSAASKLPAKVRDKKIRPKKKAKEAKSKAANDKVAAKRRAALKKKAAVRKTKVKHQKAKKRA